MQGKRSNPYYAAQDILSRRDHSEVELRRKMGAKRFTEQQITEVVVWLKQQKLLNDRVFARNYAESIVRVKAVGPRWLYSKLQQKGVSSDITKEIVSEVFATYNERELAAQAADRWRASHPKLAEDRQRLQRFLLSRGFSFEAMQGQDQQTL